MRPARFALAAALGLSLAATAARAERPARPFGLGLMIGAPTGLTGKYYLGGRTALQMGVGAVEHFGHDEGLHLHLEAIWHPAILARTPAFTLPFYLGVGGRLLHHDEEYYYDNGRLWYEDDDTHIGVRAPFGLLMDFNRVPLDVFLELALVVDVIHVDDDDPYDHPHDSVLVNGALGVRYYF